MASAERDENGTVQLNPKVDEAGEPTKPAPTSLEKAAAAFGVGKQYIADVKRIEKEAPEVYKIN